VLVGWGALLLALAAGLVVSASMRWWWSISVAGTAGAAAWLITRVWGYPFGPITGTPEVTVLELVLLAAQLTAAGLAGAVAPTTGFDLTVPRAWVYANDSDDAPAVGLLDDVVGSHPPLGFTGSDDEWHLHPGECLVDDGSGGTIAVPLDPVVTGDDCDLVDGERTARVHWMLRVWSVPGWDSPLGVFAHDHPGLPAT
jgi:hypothetical protein